MPLVIDILFRVISSENVTVKIGKIAVFMTFYPGEGAYLSVRLTTVRDRPICQLFLAVFAQQ